MYADDPIAERFVAARHSAGPPWGDAIGCLRLADWSIVVDGLDRTVSRGLAERWGACWTNQPEPTPTLRLALQSAAERWLPAPRPGELYRIEAAGRDDGFHVRSYQFIAWPDGPGLWRASVFADGEEPAGRTVENLLRYLVARLAVEAGGVPWHGAGVLRGRKAFVFVGPSRAGKSTAVGLSVPPGCSLGDDMSVLIQRDGRWWTVALPFDNAGGLPSGAPAGWQPLAGVWRLFQAEQPRVVEPPKMTAAASAMTAVAFPWALRDLSARLLDAVDRLVHDGLYGHLHFALDPGFWEHLPLDHADPPIDFAPR